MYVVGLTGGIGSGKTTIAHFFLKKGISLYDCDFFAKKLMNQNPYLIIQLKEIFGPKAYHLGSLNTSYIAKKIFSDKENLKKINNLVHPYVKEDFEKWKKNQPGIYCIKESAILFESGFYKDCEFIISVITNLEERIKRIKKRDGLDEKEILDRIKNQTSDDERIKKAQFLIFNKGNLEETKKEVEKLHSRIINKFKTQNNNIL